MDLITTQVSPREYFQLRKLKISEELKCLKDFMQRYNSIFEIFGMVDEVTDYLQSLRQDIQEIQSSVQCGEAPISSNVNGTYMHYEQERSQQSAYLKSILNQESDMVMSPYAQNFSCFRQKRWSKVWEDFTKYVGEDGKEWAKCKNCKKEFGGSSKSGITHLKNHLKSCPGYRNPGGVADKEREKNLIRRNLNDLVRRIIKSGLNEIKDEILDVYEQEKYKFQGYLDKLSSHFSVTIEWMPWCFGFRLMRIWFIDDSWKLRNKIIFLSKCTDGDDVCEIMKSLLVDWNMQKKICSMITTQAAIKKYEEVVENLNNWFNEQGTTPFLGVGTFVSHSFLLEKSRWNFNFHKLKEISQNKTLIKASNLWHYVNTSLNYQKFECAVEKALAMGKIVTLPSVPDSSDMSHNLLEWIIECKEAFCELEYIDPNFKSINFRKEDWDDATSLYSGWQVLKDVGKEIENLLDFQYETIDVYFPMVCQLFFALVQLRKSDNYYIHYVASRWENFFVKYWKNSRSVLEIKVILDPRCKMEMVEHHYKMIYDNEAETQLQKTIDDVTNIYNEYVKGTSSSSLSSHRYGATPESELDRYLRDEHPQDEEFDILQWWSNKSRIYPILTRMARDFLSVPITTPNFNSFLKVVVEDIYARKALDDIYKCKLSCTKIWLDNLE